MKDSEGSAYFDCLQLEESEFANDYNMVENSGFDYSRDGAPGMFSWATYNVDAAKAIENGKIKIVRDSAGERAVYQDIPVNKANAVLAIRGTAQGFSVPNIAGDSPYNYQMSCKLTFADNFEKWVYIPFNSSISDLQCVYGNIVVDEHHPGIKLNSIRIETRFHYNCNTIYFGNIQVCDDDNGVVYERNNKGSITEITSSLGNKTVFTRDPVSNEVTKIKDHQNNESDFSFRASPKYHQMAYSLIPTAGGKVKTTLTHDAFGNVTNSQAQAESGQGKIIESSSNYTNSGNYKDSVTDSRNKSTVFSYDEKNGNLNSETTDGVTTDYAYDVGNRMTSESRSGSQVNYNYSNGELSSVSHKLGEGVNVVYNFVRNIFGKITQTKIGNHVFTTNSYDAGNGKLNQVKFANNHQVNYDYDQSGRIAKKRCYSGRDKQNGGFEYFYNNKSNLIQTFDEENNLTTKFEYDKYGRVVNIRRSDGVSGDIKYNPLENLVEKVISKIFGISQTVANTFGASNKFENSKITIGENSIWSKYFYNTLGQVNSKETLNSDETSVLKHEISYVNEGVNNTTDIIESINIQKKVSGNWISLGKMFSYEYDNAGNISVLKENGTAKVWYYYDGNDQLVRESNSYLGVNGQTIKYKYDFGGNIENKKIYAFIPNNNDEDLASLTAETITYGYYDNNWKDQLSSYNGQEIIYDGMGNPITYKDGWKFEWICGRKLAKSSKIGYNISCKYDDAGIRTQKIVNDVTTDFVTSGIQILAQKSGNDVITWQIDGTGSVTGFDYNGVPYFYIKNSHDDIVGITNTNGDIVAEYVYDSWGKVISVKDNNGVEILDQNHIGHKNPLRYRGYYFDAETGLYYLNARYYDPETGRFISADKENFLTEDGNDISDYNLYAYCGNNPVNKADADGEFWHIVGGAVVGGLIGGVSSIVGQAVSGQKINWKDVGISAASGALTGAITAACPSMGVLATGAIHGAIGAGTYAATERYAYGRRPSVRGTLAAGATAGILAGGGRALSKSVKNLKLFSGRNGYGYKVGKRVEILYKNPKVKGGTFVNIKNRAGKSVFRFDWDPKHRYHTHPPGHKRYKKPVVRRR